MLAERPSEALTMLEKALLLEPHLIQAQVLAVKAAIAATDVDQAALHFSRIKNPSLLPEHSCLMTEIALLRGEPRDALTELDRTCERQAELLSRISMEFESRDDIPSALLALHRISALETDNQAVKTKIAILTATQDPELAHPLLLELSELEIALLHELAFAIETARIAEDPSYSHAQVGQTLARAGSWQLAAEAFRNALRHDPEYAEARAYLGLALDQIQQNGLQELQAAADLAPDSPIAHLFLGRHWRRAGEFARALIALEKAAQLEPADPGIVAELAAGYLAAGQIPEAKAAYLLAVELAPQNAFFWGLLADFSIEQEIEVDSLGLLAARAGLRLSPADPLMYDRIASGYFLMGNLTLADRFLGYAVELAPSIAIVQYHLGLLRHAQGDSGRARDALEMALSLDSDGPVAELARRTLARIGP